MSSEEERGSMGIVHGSFASAMFEMRGLATFTAYAAVFRIVMMRVYGKK